MPGAYAHITLANLAREPARLEKAGITPRVIVALNDWLRFVELGAVSPDYPYLAGSSEARWADQMHYTNNSTLLRTGVQMVKNLARPEQDQALAWLFGFAAHMTGDMTIHPVVESVVGPYAQNKSAHRNCEMHQDAYIFARLNLGDVGLAKHLESGIARCHGPRGPDQVDPVVDMLWRAMLKSAYPSEFAKAAPNIDAWHSGFNRVLVTIRKVNTLLPFARHVAVNLKLDYPAKGKIDHTKYIHNLPTPEGRMEYDTLFDRAIANVLTVWAGLDAAIFSAKPQFLTQMTDWNLDTGRSVQTGKLVLWKNP